MKNLYRRFHSIFKRIKYEGDVASYDFSKFIGRFFKILGKIGIPFVWLGKSFLLNFSQVDPKSNLGRGGNRFLLGLLPIIGYTIVLVSFVDFLFILVPLRLQNPVWELETIGSFTENIWAFLIGLGFIFSRYFSENHSSIRFFEIFFLRFMRWFIFIMALFFVLAIPLVFLDTYRILTISKSQIIQQREIALIQLGKAEAFLNQGPSLAQVKELGRFLKLTPQELELPANLLKEKVSQTLATAKTKVPIEAAQAERQQWLSTWKKSSRILISLVILSITFLIIGFSIGRALI